LRVRYSPNIPWSIWQEFQFTEAELGDALFSGEYADPDNDGILNLMEYAMGLPPKVNSQANLPTMTRSNNVITMLYRKNVDAPDVALDVQVSTTLTQWTTTEVFQSVIGTANGIQTVQATYNVPASTPSIFMRIRALK